MFILNKVQLEVKQMERWNSKISRYVQEMLINWDVLWEDVIFEITVRTPKEILLYYMTRQFVNRFS